MFMTLILHEEISKVHFDTAVMYVYIAVYFGSNGRI